MITFAPDLNSALAMGRSMRRPVLALLSYVGCLECAAELRIWNASAILASTINNRTVPVNPDIYSTPGIFTVQNIRPDLLPYLKGTGGASLPVRVLIDPYKPPGTYFYRSTGVMGDWNENNRLQLALASFKPPA